MSKHPNGRSGTLDFKNISLNRGEILSRIIPVMFKANYGSEESMVIVNDKEGLEVSRLNWKNKRFYDEYPQENTTFTSKGNTMCTMPCFELFVDCGVNPSTKRQTDYEWQNGWLGSMDFLNPIIDALADIISPIETLFVLMHAISEDPKAIFAFVESGYMNELEFLMAERQYWIEFGDQGDEVDAFDWDQINMYPLEYPQAKTPWH